MLRHSSFPPPLPPLGGSYLTFRTNVPDHIQAYALVGVLVQMVGYLLNHFKLTEDVDCIRFGVVAEKEWDQDVGQLDEIVVGLVV